MLEISPTKTPEAFLNKVSSTKIEAKN